MQQANLRFLILILMDNYHFSCKNMKSFNNMMFFLYTYFPVRPVLRFCCTTSTLFSAEQSLKVRQCFKPGMIHGPRDGWCTEFIWWRWMFLTSLDAPETKKKALLQPQIQECAPLFAVPWSRLQFFSCRWCGTSNILPCCFYHFHQCL